MPRVVAFLRAINVGGHTVTMAELRRLFEGLALREVETFIASGNVIFTTRSSQLQLLEHRIETRLEQQLGYEVKTFLRTGEEIGAIASYRPFIEAQRENAATLCVGFLAAPLGAAARKALTALKTDIDDFHLQGRELYWCSRSKQGESVISNVRLERTLKARLTFRGVNTISRLAARYAFSALTQEER